MKIVWKYILLCCACLFFNQIVFSQNDSTYFQLPEKKKKENKKQFNWDRISIGGNFALYTSTRYSFVDISPIIGYKISKWLLVGAGPVYTYYSELYGSIKYKFDMYGFRTIGRVYILEGVFAQVGWDKLNRSIYEINYNNIIQEKRIWIDNLWIGGGIRYSIGGNTYMLTSVLFNLNQNAYSPYTNPYIQVGFIVGF